MRIICCDGGIWPIVCATGHRPWSMTHDQRTWTRAKLAAAIVHLRDLHGMTVGLSGMAQGTDLWWADEIVRAGLTLGAHVPCEDQTARWRTSGDIAEWSRLRAAADPAYSYRYAEKYSQKIMFQRNDGMIAAAACVVCVYLPGQTGGTRGAVETARRLRRPGFHLNPDTFTVQFGLPPLDASQTGDNQQMILKTGRNKGLKLTPHQFANDWISATTPDGQSRIVRPPQVQLEPDDFAMFADRDAKHVGQFWKMWELAADGTFSRAPQAVES